MDATLLRAGKTTHLKISRSGSVRFHCDRRSRDQCPVGSSPDRFVRRLTALLSKQASPASMRARKLLPFAEDTVRAAVVNWREARDDRETFCRALDGS